MKNAYLLHVARESHMLEQIAQLCHWLAGKNLSVMATSCAIVCTPVKQQHISIANQTTLTLLSGCKCNILDSESAPGFTSSCSNTPRLKVNASPASLHPLASIMDISETIRCIWALNILICNIQHWRKCCTAKM